MSDIDCKLHRNHILVSAAQSRIDPNQEKVEELYGFLNSAYQAGIELARGHFMNVNMQLSEASWYHAITEMNEKVKHDEPDPD